MTIETNNQPAVLIPSCDNYSDVWGPFFHLFDKYWPGCPYDVYLVTNFLESPSPRAKAIKIGKEPDYSSKLLSVLEQIDNEYIIIWLEDLLLCRTMHPQFSEMIDEAIKLNIGYVRLWKSKELGKKVDGFFHKLPKGMRFRVSLKPALWKKETLKKILFEGETIHQLERNGTRRSYQKDDLFLSVNSSAEAIRISIKNAIYRGKYHREALTYIERMGYKMDENGRQVHSSLFDSFEKFVIKPLDTIYDLISHNFFVKKS